MSCRILLAAGLLLTFASACGGGATGLQHTVSDKQLVGLDAEATGRIETAKGEVLRTKDVFAKGDFEIRSQEKDIEAAGTKADQADDAIDAASDTIEATGDKMETELRQAQAKRDEQIAQARERYNADAKGIRERFEKQQATNRAGLESAKRSKEMAQAEGDVEKAELAEAKARSAVRSQEIMVAKAKLEVIKLEEIQKLSNVIGPAETQQKATFDAQLAGEQKKLDQLQAKLDAQVKATELARAKVQQHKARVEGAPK